MMENQATNVRIYRKYIHPDQGWVFLVKVCDTIL